MKLPQLVIWRRKTAAGAKFMVTPSLVLAAAAAAVMSLGHTRPSNEALMLDYEAQAKALQTEMAALKRSDGGQLTPDHLAHVQKKLIALLDAYHDDVQKDDPFSVNADGSPAR